MKKGFVYKITWAVLVILGLFAASCNKDLKVDVKDVKIINEHVDSTTNSVKITGEYVFPSVLKAIDVYLSNNENLLIFTHKCILFKILLVIMPLPDTIYANVLNITIAMSLITAWTRLALR